MKMFKWLKEFFSDKEHNDIKTEYDEFVKKQNEELEKNCVSSDYFHFLLNRISNYDLFEIEYSYGDYEINEIEDKRGVHIYYSPTCYYKPRVTVFINANRIILNDRQDEIVFNNIKSMIEDFENKESQKRKSKKEFELNEYRKKHE